MIFADDTNIFVCDDNHEEVVKKANSVLTAVSSYMHTNKLHINMKKCCMQDTFARATPSARATIGYLVYKKKCCYMHFRPKIGIPNGGQDNNNQHTRIRINDYEIDEVEATKFLGVTIDNKLT